MSDAAYRLQITDSCRVLETHAKYIGMAVLGIGVMPKNYVPPCLSDLEQAEITLRNALTAVEHAKRELSAKPRKAA